MGIIGLDRFYLGYMIFGIVKAITFGGFGIWAIIDVISISHCWLKDSDGNIMIGCPEDPNVPDSIDGNSVDDDNSF